ncbi:hypothetical protein SUDANB148_02976 [Streptomyces sp. SudanB148_2056]|uniref:hypothetical protein n=1 Tax=Streptomyces sp. SudanB148_2056 TaxID=3035280 RepID=UPI003F57C98F
MEPTMTRTCETCPSTLPPKKKTGPAARFCGECKRARHNARSRARYVHKGYPQERPERRRYNENWVSPSGELTLVERIVGKPDRALFKCICGNVREMSINNVRTVRDGKPMVHNCADRTKHPDPRRTSTPAYATVHHRKARLEGPASDHPCWLCGGPAEHHAFLHGTHDVLADETGREAGLPYSDDPEQLAPLCRSCHGRWDEAKQRTAGDGLSLAHIALWLATHNTDSDNALEVNR